MTIVTKGMGAIIKKFGKKTAKHMADTKTRHKSWKKMGLKGPTYKIGKKVKGSHHLDEVWTFDKNYPKGKAKGGRIGFKSGAGPVGNLPWVRGTSRPGVRKAPRGAEHKEAIKKEKEYKKLIGPARKTGNIKNKKGEVVGSRIAKAGSLKAMGIPRPHMKKSDFRLKNQLKRIQKMPDKKFKSYNPAKETRKSRHGTVHEVHKPGPVKGSLGKKTYKQHAIHGHRAHQRMGLIKD